MKLQALGAGLTGVAVMALAGCTQPTPDVTVWSGTSSVVRPATCWSTDVTVSQAVKDCIAGAQNQPAADIPAIQVTPGDVIGINVDPDVAEATWVPTVGQQALSPAPISESYFRFTYPERIETPPEGFLLVVTARGTAADQDRGLWLFRIVPPAP